MADLILIISICLQEPGYLSCLGLIKLLGSTRFERLKGSILGCVFQFLAGAWLARGWHPAGPRLRPKCTQKAPRKRPEGAQKAPRMRPE